MTIVKQRNVTFVGNAPVSVPRVLSHLGFLSWHKDEPNWVEWNTHDITAADRAAGFISAPCFINSQVRK